MDENNYKKQHLDATMHISHVFEDVRQSYKTLLWTIRAYNLLKLNSVYDCFDRLIGWHLFIRKETDYVKITARSEDIKNITCSIVCDDNEILYSVSGTEVSKDAYLFTFPSSAVEDSKNEPLKRDHVLFNFKFNEVPEIKQVYPHNPAKNYKSNQLTLLKDLQYFAVKQKLKQNTDDDYNQLTINAKGKDILVPKALLAARSQFFKDSDGENVINVNASEESVHIAVEYLYTNVLPVAPDDKDIKELIEVAQILKIKSLELKCLSLIHKNSTLDGFAKHENFQLQMLEVKNF